MSEKVTHLLDALETELWRRAHTIVEDDDQLLLGDHIGERTVYVALQQDLARKLAGLACLPHKFWKDLVEYPDPEPLESERSGEVI